MNQKEVRSMFRDDWDAAVKANPRLATDKAAKNEAFGILIDGLCKSGQITDKQYNNMTMEDTPSRLKQYRVMFHHTSGGVSHEFTNALNIEQARTWAKKRGAEEYQGAGIHVSYEGKARKTTDDFDIEQDAGAGWEVVSSESTRKAAKAAVKEYRENQPEFAVRWVKRRVKIETKA